MIKKGISSKPNLIHEIRYGSSTKVNITSCLVDFNHKWLWQVDEPQILERCIQQSKKIMNY